MRSSSKLVWIRINFRVNDLEFRQALMRPSERDATDFQIVIEDRFLGPFALHEDFDLQLRDREGVRDWRKVSLEELKMAFSRNAPRCWRRWNARGRRKEYAVGRLGCLRHAQSLVSTADFDRR